MEGKDTNNILSLLDNYTMTNADDIARDIADGFRRRRVERNLTREEVAEMSGVALANIVRFEQKALISLGNLISLAMALGYTSDIHSLFSQPKYSTMEELLTIRKNQKKKRVRKQQNLFVKPDEQSDACINSAMARKGRIYSNDKDEN